MIRPIHVYPATAPEIREGLRIVGGLSPVAAKPSCSCPEKLRLRGAIAASCQGAAIGGRCAATLWRAPFATGSWLFLADTLGGVLLHISGARGSMLRRLLTNRLHEIVSRGDPGGAPGSPGVAWGDEGAWGACC